MSRFPRCRKVVVGPVSRVEQPNEYSPLAPLTSTGTGRKTATLSISALARARSEPTMHKTDDQDELRSKVLESFNLEGSFSGRDRTGPGRSAFAIVTALLLTTVAV